MTTERLRAAQRVQIRLQLHHGAPESPLETPDLDGARFHPSRQDTQRSGIGRLGHPAEALNQGTHHGA